MEKEKKKKQKLIRLTTGHGEKSYGIIKEVARDNNCSMGFVVRAATSNHLDKYCGRLRFYNEETSIEIKQIYLDILKDVNKLNLNLAYMGKDLDDARKLSKLRNFLKHKNHELEVMEYDDKPAYEIKEKQLEIAELEDEIKELEAIPDIANAVDFVNASDEFLDRLGYKIDILKDIATQKGEYIHFD